MITDAVEAFCRDHQHTIEALTAFGTLSAVVVSLIIARRANKQNETKLEAYANIVGVYGAGVPQPAPRYLSVTVTNIGNHQLRLPYAFFNWRIPFSGEYATVNPLNASAGDPYYQQIRYPVTVEPRASYSAALSTKEVFQASMRDIATKYKWLVPLRFRWMRAFIWTEDRVRCRVQLDASILREIKQAAKNPEPWNPSD